MMMNNAYKGVVVPVVTPFNKEKEIDHQAAIKIYNYLMDSGTIPFILGTTGEGPCIPCIEREKLVKILVEQRREDVPLIAGVLGLSFDETVKVSNKYVSWGINAVVLSLPNFYNLDEEQMLAYFQAIADRINGHIILYNIPKTTYMSIPIKVIERLSHRENIIGVKDSELNENRLKQSLSLWKDREDFFHFTGVNKLMPSGIRLGSKGIVPSTANFMPGLYTDMIKAIMEGQNEHADQLFRKSETFGKLYQFERTLGESLSALKTIMAYRGFCYPNMMEPLSQTKESDSEKIIYNYNKTIFSSF